jgi:nicotinamidase-related amidase
VTIKALLIVNVQQDFRPSNQLLETIDKLISSPAYRVVIVSLDSHPYCHTSFETQPQHCVTGTPGWKLPANINKHVVNRIFEKGTHPDLDPQSGFQQDDRLDKYLKVNKITHIDIIGIDTDQTALDATQRGYKTCIIQETYSE